MLTLLPSTYSEHKTRMSRRTKNLKQLSKLFTDEEFFNEGNFVVKAIIFDLDGTLVDSAPDLIAAMNYTAVRYGLEPLTPETYGAAPGKGGLAMLSSLISGQPHAVELQNQDQFIADFRAFYAQCHTDNTQMFQGVETCLKQLRLEGCMIAVCTNKPEPYASEVCKAVGLDNLTDIIVGRTPQLPPKPAPDMVAKCYRDLPKTFSEALFVGDSPADQMAASDFGIPFMLYEKGYVAKEVSNPTHSFYDYLEPQLASRMMKAATSISS